jgi:hypothetical protein
MRNLLTQESERKAIFLACLTVVMYTIPTLLKDQVLLFPLPFYSLLFFVLSLLSGRILFSYHKIGAILLVFSALCWLGSEQFLWSELMGEVRATSEAFQDIYVLIYSLFLLTLAGFLTSCLVQRVGVKGLLVLPFYTSLHAFGLLFGSDFFIVISLGLALVFEVVFTKKTMYENAYTYLPVLGLLVFLHLTKAINVVILNGI